MPRRKFDPLSAQDASFLFFASPTTPMNVGGPAVWEGGQLLEPDGGVDLTRIKRLIASRLHLVPRYRQRIAYVPVENEPVWVDDERFDLDFHVRHPGTMVL